MTQVHRVLPPDPVRSLDEHLKRRGGRGLTIAREVEPEALIDEVEAAGLRGRGGAGFPTHIKWRTVRDFASSVEGTTVVVNGAEGEPGTFKDRTILCRNPYEVIEGALIAAIAVGAERVVFGLKRSFGEVVTRVRAAIAEMDEAGWTGDIEVVVFEGPDEYLYGEETALLESIDAAILPRLAPPYRRGVDEVVETEADTPAVAASRATSRWPVPSTRPVPHPRWSTTWRPWPTCRASSPGAGPGSAPRAPTSPRAPSCAPCSGAVNHAGVAEFLMGTPLREVIETIGGGIQGGRPIIGILNGVSNALLTPDDLDAPVSYEGLAAVGSGLGSAGFVVYDDRDDLVAAVAGVSRFLSIESCGQCTPCKLAWAWRWPACSTSSAGRRPTSATWPPSTSGWRRWPTAPDASWLPSRRWWCAACSTASKRRRPGHLHRRIPGVEPMLVAELVTIDDDTAILDERHRTKQPHWSYGDSYSGQVRPTATASTGHRPPCPTDRAGPDRRGS